MCYMGSRTCKDTTKNFAELAYNCPQETNPAEFFIDLVSLDMEDPIEAAEDKAGIEEFTKAFSLCLIKLKATNSTWLPAVSSNGTFHQLQLIRWSLALL